MPALFEGLDFWTVAQATALVSAVFGVFTVARACWDNTGLPALQDRYLELVSARAAELRSGVPAGRQGAAAYTRHGPLGGRSTAGSAANGQQRLAPPG